MEIIIAKNIIAGPNVKPSLAAGIAVLDDGIAQIRQVDPRGRIIRDGLVVLFMKDDKGNEVTVKVNPDELLTLCSLLPMVAYAAAGVPVPVIEVKDVKAPVHLIGVKQ